MCLKNKYRVMGCQLIPEGFSPEKEKCRVQIGRNIFAGKSNVFFVTVI